MTVSCVSILLVFVYRWINVRKSPHLLTSTTEMEPLVPGLRATLDFVPTFDCVAVLLLWLSTCHFLCLCLYLSVSLCMAAYACMRVFCLVPACGYVALSSAELVLLDLSPSELVWISLCLAICICLSACLPV